MTTLGIGGCPEFAVVCECVFVFVVLSFCDLTVFAFFLQDYKYGENENRWQRLVCVSILGLERKKNKNGLKDNR